VGHLERGGGENKQQRKNEILKKTNSAMRKTNSIVLKVMILL
jgi:hypothetical protein